MSHYTLRRMANSPARSGIDVGSVIADTYTIEALIGRGGMGAVFLASHKRLPGKKVAIKVLHAELSGQEVLHRFEREAQIASKLGHPNIVGVTDYNVMPDGTPYLVLEYLEGESLAQQLRNGPLPLEHVMSIVRQVGSALAAAHREGIVHRDLKPQNIFMVPSEVENRVVDVAKVLDFGISKIRGSQTVKTQEAALLGTPQYMAPEQATGQHDKVDGRTDIFALGAIVHEMMSGQPAFSGANIPEVVFKVVYEQPADLAALAPATPPAVLAAVKRAMEKKAEDRFQTVAELVEAITGQPLAIVPKMSSIPPPDAAAPRSRNSGKEAFDATVGSGDHSQAAAQVAPSRGNAPAGSDATVASADGSAQVAPVAPVRGSAPTVDSGNAVVPNIAPPAPAAAARRPRALLWIVAGVIVAGGAAAFVMTRGDNKQPTVAKAPPPEREVLTPEPVPVEAPKPPPDMVRPEINVAPATGPQNPAETKKPADVKTPVETKKPVDTQKSGDTKKPADGKPADGKPVDTKNAADVKEAEEPAAAGEDETAAAKLRDAQAALQAEDYAKAEQLANAVINGEHSGPGQKARAHVIHGIVACVAHNALGDANADARALAGTPKLQKRLMDRCATVNIHLEP